LTCFLEAFLDQALRICPDISLLLPPHKISSDGELGIFDFSGFYCSHQLLLCPQPVYLIVKNGKGGYRKVHWNDNWYYDKLYSIDRNGKRYYLLVNLSGDIDDMFSLVCINKGEVKECLEPVPKNILQAMRDFSSNPERYNSWEWLQNQKEERIIFNPEKLAWKECRLNKNGYWAEFPNSRTFRLVFGEKISIEME